MQAGSNTGMVTHSPVAFTARSRLAYGMWFWPLVSILAAATVNMRLQAGAWTIDDAYITFTYARNIAEGHGFVFNPGDHVLGTTTPLYTLLLALLLKLTGASLPTLALGMAAAADGCNVLLTCALAQAAGVSRLAALLVATTFALVPHSFFFGQSGMESSLITTMTLMCVWLYAGERERTFGACAGFALLTRPDASLLVAILVVAWVIQRRVISWRGLVVIALVCGPWVAWATWSFGQPLPQSMLAKGGGLYVLGVSDTARTVVDYVSALILPADDRPFGILLLGVTFVFAWRAVGPLAPALRPAFVWAVVFTAGYAVGGVRHVAVEPWYLVPLAPVLLLIAWIGVDSSLRHVPRSVQTLGLLVFATILFSTQFSGLTLRRDAAGRLAVAPIPFDDAQREHGYEIACRHLAPHLTPSTVVASSEIGTLGYYCHATIMDVAGLVTRGMDRYYPVPLSQVVPGSVYAIPPRLIDDSMPMYVISHEVLMRNSLLTDATFRRRYVQVDHIDSTLWGSRGLLVFRRR